MWVKHILKSAVGDIHENESDSSVALMSVVATTSPPETSRTR